MERLKIEKIEPEVRYGLLGLDRNSFPSNGAFLEPPRVKTFPDERLREEIENFLGTVLHGGEATKEGRSLIGEYGTGKTFYLKMIHYFVREDFPSVASFYIQNPGYGFHDFVGSIVGTIGLGNIVRKLWSLVREELLNRVKEKDLSWYYAIFSPSGRHQSWFDTSLHEHILSDRRTFFDYAKKQKANVDAMLNTFSEVIEESLGITANGARKLSRILMESHYKSYFDWEDVAPKRQKEIGDYEFLSAIFSLIKKVDNYNFILILVDEFEEIPSSKRFNIKEATDYEYTLRRFFDLVNALPLGIIIALTPRAWELTGEYCEPLSSRFLRPIWIQPLDKHGAKKLVVAYLNDAREKKESLSPFPDNLWGLLPDVVRGKPRNLLNFCHDAIEIAASRQLSPISEALVKEISSLWTSEFKERGK
jgi:type II secretory pathway predicted ATPase ExeA